ncbi:heme A synthase [Pseudoalteromonas sp. MMG012]|uniref:COX15/CtaA family protein n=1 Tax=Pseudoalteromonas sp. MMG012 TaxID=2822686 RepID=UPI001B3A535C|nr:COX15/CtaA family protein [Pseudoalteromonas sp. MMG012]MBQ4850458.1 COX15/CtaA family protein [Pseudoalteromonas sp. MMG012]
MQYNYRKIALFGCLLAAVVVTLGAYTRLSNSGLGCPDWPGCYGFMSVPTLAEDVFVAQSQFPESEIEHEKAWIEMIHRYFAAILGLLVLFLCVIAIKYKRESPLPTKLVCLLTLLILFQGALGMWTVTMNLQPFIVMGHLLGGFSILSLLSLLYFRVATSLSPLADKVSHRFKMVLFVLGILVIQIALGGWVAANYAAPHCTGLPACNNMELFSINSLFHLPIGQENYEYGVLPFETRLSIHFVHRFWALVTSIAIFVMAIKLYALATSTTFKYAILWVVALLIIQLSVGAAIVYLQFPLLLTLFHNFMAAMLLTSMVRLCFLIKYRCGDVV